MNLVNKGLGCLLLTLTILPMQGCARDYSAKSIEAWVVDAKTGKPVEGANVVANWELNYGLEGGGAYQLQIMEAVTDKNGRFFFPAWGPKEIPEHLPSEARFQSHDDPGIVIFKPGYAVKGIANDRPLSSMSGHGDSIRTSDWDGKTIKISKFQGDIQKYSRNIYVAQYMLSYVQPGKNCEWRLLPRMILTLTKEIALLKRENVSLPSYLLRSIDDLPNQASCGSAQEIFEAYQQ